MANTFYVIRAEEKNRLLIFENASTCRIITIAESQYNGITLKDAVLTALNTGRSMSGQYTVTYDTPTNKLLIGNLDAAATFHIHPTAWLKANSATWNAAAGGSLQIDASDLMDAGSVVGFATGTEVVNKN